MTHVAVFTAVSGLDRFRHNYYLSLHITAYPPLQWIFGEFLLLLIPVRVLSG
jgi:hypothetical protein